MCVLFSPEVLQAGTVKGLNCSGYGHDPQHTMMSKSSV